MEKNNHKNRVRTVILLLALMGMSFIFGCKWGSWDLFGGEAVNGDDSGNRGNSNGLGFGNGNDDTAGFPPVVFSAARSGTKINEPIQLYSSFDDGSAIIVLTDIINRDSIGDDFKVSPDGTLVAYLSNENNGQFELFVVPVDGGDSILISPRLSDNEDVVEFKWSPDSSRIAYLADITIDEQFDLYTNLAVGGSNLKVSGTLPADGQVISFEWSPDSRRLAYIADERNLGQFELFSTLPTQTNSDPPVSGNFFPNNGNVLDFAWSPGSTRIAYLSNQQISSLAQLYTNLPTGGDNTRVSAGDNVTGFAWAPAERTELLAYSTARQIDTVFQDGSNRTQITPALTSGGTIAEFAWAPDNSRIAYRADQNVDEVVELFAVRSEGGDNRKVSGELTATGSVTDFAWAPYSDFIAYRANQDIAVIFELYVTSPDGSSGDRKVSGTPMAGGVEPDFAWSPEQDPPEPDRVRVAYRANQRNADTIELFTSTPDGQTNDRVCAELDDGGLVEGFAWASDNSGIGYIADQVSLEVFELFASLPDGRENTKLSGSIASSGDVLFFEWVP